MIYFTGISQNLTTFLIVMAANCSSDSLCVDGEYNDAVCVLCKCANNLITMRSDGKKTLLKNSIERGDDALRKIKRKIFRITIFFSAGCWSLWVECPPMIWRNTSSMS